MPETVTHSIPERLSHSPRNAAVGIRARTSLNGLRESGARFVSLPDPRPHYANVARNTILPRDPHVPKDQQCRARAAAARPLDDVRRTQTAGNRQAEGFSGRDAATAACRAGYALARKSAETPRESPSDWGAETLRALDGVARPGALPGSERATGFTVRKSPSLRSNTSLASLKSKSRPASITDKTSEVEPSEPRHVPAVVAATLHETETGTTPVAKAAKTPETADPPATGDHVARLGRVFDTYFGEAAGVDTPAVTPPSVKPPSGKDKHTPVVADVPQAARNAQLDATRASNERFERSLAGQDMQPIRNSGRDNNCSIYALVQCARPDLDGPALDQAVSEIRAGFDAQHPDERGRMLLLDTNEGGHGAALVSLVNEKFGVDMQVGVVQAGVDDTHPVTTLGQFHGSQHRAGQVPTHRVVVWDQHGHFEAITSTPGKAAGSGIDATKPKPASPTPTVTTPPPADLATGKRADDPPKKTDGTTNTGKKEAAPRPHGEALGQLVPNASVGAKALRRFGRWIKVDNENALPQLLNRTKPEGGIVQGLTKAHLTASPASALALAHEGVNTVYAAQELGSSALRKSRYQKQLGNWPASADEPKVATGGHEVPLSEVAERPTSSPATISRWRS